MKENEKTLADHFNENGYDTAYIGKWHLASDRAVGKGCHCEKNNLVNNESYAKIIQQMRTLLAREMVNAGEKRPVFHKPLKTKKF